MAATAQRVREIKPQPGPQTAFLSSGADFVIYGGARGGGKTFAALLEPLRHVHVPNFNAVIFRRNSPQITNAGGLWDKSCEIYPALKGKSSIARLWWRWPNGVSIAFRHLQLEDHKFDWMGLEVCLIEFEELTHFTKTQFIFLLGSNRSTCGVQPYIRATCNPDADSWVRELVVPFLADDGYADLSQVGQIKYFVVEDNEFKFVEADHRDSLGLPPISYTYINADVWDNEALLKTNPGYVRNLMSQCLVDRERFLGVRGRGGNWNTRATAGKVFRAEWFPVIDYRPIAPVKQVRFWDLAATEKQQKGDDPDWTVGVKMGQFRDLGLVVLDVVRLQGSPSQVDSAMRNTASQDGPQCMQRWFRDPAQAGVYQDAKLRSLLAGYDAMGLLSPFDKFTRAKPFSRAAEFGEVRLVRSEWNAEFVKELSNFPDGDHDDQVDAGSGAYAVLVGSDVVRRSAGVGEMSI